MINVTKIDRIQEGLNPTVLNLLIDVTGSMNDLHEESIPCDAINEILVPALKGAHPDRKSLLRVSLGAFADGKIEGLTRGYLSVEQLMRNPIRNHQLYKPGLNRQTALYRAMINGIRSCHSAAKTLISMSPKRFQVVKSHVFILTDGKNYTNDTTTTRDVCNAIREAKASGEVDLRVYLAYFRTETGLSESEFRSVAKECGVLDKNCYFWDRHGKTLHEQKKEFRAKIEVISRMF